METAVQNLLDAFADPRRRANANACFGKPVTTGDCTAIPVAEMAYAFEMEIECSDEAGRKDTGGGGMRVRPFAVVEYRRRAHA